MRDDSRTPSHPDPSAGIEQRQGGDVDVAADISPPAPAPDEPEPQGGQLGDYGRPDRATGRPGGMAGEG